MMNCHMLSYIVLQHIIYIYIYILPYIGHKRKYFRVFKQRKLPHDTLYANLTEYYAIATLIARGVAECK